MPADGNIRIAIVGGGISGLACALRLLQESEKIKDKLEIVLLEASARVGGVLETINWQDCYIESGPDMFITNPPYLKDLVARLGLSERLIKVQDGPGVGGALVLRKGRLHKVPDGFVMLAPSRLWPFALSPLVSPLGKLRALLEPLIPRASGSQDNGQDESLAQFVRRRFGREVLDNLAQPMVAGVYVGDAEKLSAQCVATRFVEMERTAGSVTTSLLKSAGVKASGARYGLFASFDKGMSVLTEGLSQSLSGKVKVRLSTRLLSLQRDLDGDKQGGGFTLQLEEKTGDKNESLACHYVVLTLPAAQCAALLQDVNSELASVLEKIEAASSAVVNMVFARNDLRTFERKHGSPFGALVPDKERRQAGISTIAVSFASNKFAGRSPQEKLVLRIFFKDGLEDSDQALKARALADLRKMTILAKEIEPQYWAVHRYREAMPQYNLGHKELIAQLESVCAGQKEKGIFLAGASYQGVGLPDCVNSGNLCAERLLSQLYASNLDADLGEVHERQT